MKKSVVVVLSDSKHLEYAKQVFSGVYHNSGWRGDYLLLAHQISSEKAEWFKSHGIIIKNCKPLVSKNVGYYPPSLISKLYLFSTFFKRWENVIYLDTDTMVFASLNNLIKLKSFYAAKEADNKKIRNQFGILKGSGKTKDKSLFDKFENKFNTDQQAFNAGVLAFNTSIIKNNTFNNLLKLLNTYKDISLYGDQGILNLYFAQSCKNLSRIYNLYPEDVNYRLGIEWGNIKGLVLHFVGTDKNVKPWHKNNYYYKTWKRNLQKAEVIDANNFLASRQFWVEVKIYSFSYYMLFLEMILRIKKRFKKYF